MNISNWVLKMRNTSEAVVYSGHNTHLGHYTDHSPMSLGQYDNLGQCCGPHTASSVFLILVCTNRRGNEILGRSIVRFCSVWAPAGHESET